MDLESPLIINNYVDKAVKIIQIQYHRVDDSFQQKVGDTYQGLIGENDINNIRAAINGSHTDIAQALYYFYQSNFTYRPDQGKWFQLRNNKWEEDVRGLGLRKVISGDFVRRFQEYRTILVERIELSKDKVFIHEMEATINQITNVIKDLKTVRFKNSLMIEAREHFLEHFLEYF
jgi:hypothetical protein